MVELLSHPSANYELKQNALQHASRVNLFTVSCLLEKCDSFKAQLLFHCIFLQKPLQYDLAGTLLMQGFVFQKNYAFKFRSAESFVQSLHWQCKLLLSGGVSLFLHQRLQRVHQLGSTQCGNSDLLRCWHWSWPDVVHLHWTSDMIGLSPTP